MVGVAPPAILLCAVNFYTGVVVLTEVNQRQLRRPYSNFGVKLYCGTASSQDERQYDPQLKARRVRPALSRNRHVGRNASYALRDTLTYGLQYRLWMAEHPKLPGAHVPLGAYLPEKFK